MKIRVVSSKEEIDRLGKDEKMIHLAFRPSNTDILSIITKCPNLKALHVSPSYKKTISRSTQMLLEIQNIALLEGDVCGHRKDINEYSEVSHEVYEIIDQYLAEGMADKDIEDKMVLKTSMSNELIRFLIKSRKL